jgi:hypothetical protein
MDPLGPRRLADVALDNTTNPTPRVASD